MRPVAAHILTAMAGLVALPFAALAQDIPPRAGAFVALVQANDCAITEAQAQALLPPAGLTMDDAQDAAALMNRGRLFTVDADGETLRLTPELCAADAAGVDALLAAAAAAPAPGARFLDLGERVDPARGADFIGAVRTAGCLMSEDQAEAILPPLGFAPEDVQDIAGLLMITGRAGMAGDSFALHPDLCTADAAGDADEMVAALAEFAAGGVLGPVDDELVRGALVAMALSADCTLDAADPAALAAAVAEWLNLDAGVEAADLDALTAGVIAAPGPEFSLNAGQLRLDSCEP